MYRKRTVPLYKDKKWSAELIDKSSFKKYKNSYVFNLTFIEIITKYVWAITFLNKSWYIHIFGFKSITGEAGKTARYEISQIISFY